MSMTVDLKGVHAFQKQLGGLRASLPKAYQQALREEAELVMTAAKQAAPVNLGAMKSSGMVVSNPAAAEVAVGFGGPSAPYALYVHEGTKPHFPPSEKLVPWVVRKLKLRRAFTILSSRKRRKKNGKSEQTAETVAFLIARKISKVGTAPTKFLERPFLAATRGLTERVERRVLQLVFRQMTKMTTTDGGA